MNRGRDLPEIWAELCRTIADLPTAPGTAAHLDGGGDDERTRVEGYRFLARTVAYELTSALTASDPAAPAFIRLGDNLSKATAPNPDNICRRATISSDGLYRIRGTMGSCEDFILSITSGRWHMGTYTVHVELTAVDLGIEPGADFEVVLGGESQPGSWVPIASGADAVQIREYYFDEADAPPATFVIERIDTAGLAPPPLTAQALSQRLGRAIEDIATSVPFWVGASDGQRRSAEANRLAAPVRLPGGASKILYGGGTIDLASDDALLIEFDAPDARWWCMQLSSLPWGETIDEGGRTSSLNHRSAHVDPDGRVRVVVSTSDPGTPNWIDTGGHRPVRLLYRWIDAKNEPVPSARVVPVEAIRALVPGDAGPVTAEARRRQVEKRQRHLASRTRV